MSRPSMIAACAAVAFTTLARGAVQQFVQYQIYGSAGNFTGSQPVNADDTQTAKNPKQGVSVSDDNAAVDYGGGMV